MNRGHSKLYKKYGINNVRGGPGKIKLRTEMNIQK